MGAYVGVVNRLASPPGGGVDCADHGLRSTGLRWRPWLPRPGRWRSSNARYYQATVDDNSGGRRRSHLAGQDAVCIDGTVAEAVDHGREWNRYTVNLTADVKSARGRHQHGVNQINRGVGGVDPAAGHRMPY
jgi:hypothetical protein